MQYSTQTIICLANDLRLSAVAMHAKRILREDHEFEKDGQTIKRSKLEINGPPISLDPLYCHRNSRLIILGHGGKRSLAIIGDHGQWDPEQLAKRVEGWLGKRTIKHISLKMCFSGGFRNGGAANSPEGWHTSYVGSFGHELARRCGYATSIGAYTDTHETTYATDSVTKKVVIDGESVPYSAVGGRYKKYGDKIIFYPDPAARPDALREVVDTKFREDQNRETPW